MKMYEVACPVCGAVNKRLYLQETKGWMECDYCHSVVHFMKISTVKQPLKPIKIQSA